MPERCAICGDCNLESVVSFPDYPLTDTLCRTLPERCPPAFDLSLVKCTNCSHLQLGTFLSPTLLYGDAYRFRTGESALGRSGTAFFLKFLEKIAPQRRFRLAVDVGCNDLHCLAVLKDRACERIGVDPIWANQSVPGDSGITVIGKTIEDTNWSFLRELKSDLIICRHTLEHLSDPKAIIDQFIAHLSDDGILIVEVPGVEPMIEKFRFDQIFHQHLHYFSRAAIRRLIQQSGGYVIGEAENTGNWGAQLMAVQKTTARRATPDGSVAPFCSDIGRRYTAFRSHMQATAETLAIASETLNFFGYGAAQMLPVLAWHLGLDLECLDYVLDDDEKKSGLRYANLPLTVRHPQDCSEWQSGGILITAVDHARSILRRLDSAPPRQLIHPLSLL